MPVTFDIIELKWIKCHFEDMPSASGLYQVYGTSPIYGVDTLLYIGQAKNLNKRVKNHENRKSYIGRQPNKSYIYALLDEGLLNIVEQTLIAMHKPSFNSSNIITLKKESKNRYIYIQNHYERGMLLLEVSNFYFVDPSIIEVDVSEGK